MKWLLDAYHRRDTAEAWAEMRRWYRTPLGKRLLETESRMLQQILPELFGYHFLQVGNAMEEDLSAGSPVRNRMVMECVSRDAGQGESPKSFVGDPAAIPVATDSLDVLLLPHVIEFVRHPHEVLREADRTLIPEGHLVILAFNPWSMWGIGRLLLGWRSVAPWRGRFLSVFRLKDWLALLGFDTVAVRNYAFRPPFQHVGMMERLHFFEGAGQRWWPGLGGAYVLVARKRVATLTPIRPRWRPRRNLAGGKLANPTVRRDIND